MAGTLNLQTFSNALEAVVHGRLGERANKVTVGWRDADACARVPNHWVVLILA